jgi:glutaminyl-tRNA synthetase
MSAKSSHPATPPDFPPGGNFLRTAIDHDLNRMADEQRYWDGVPGAAVATSAAHDPARVRTRFPPEPNGYLHVGHAKAIYLNFRTARDYQGAFHLRFDDTNPEKEEQEYVDGIVDIVKWLGCDWGPTPAEKDHSFNEAHLYFASDYFEQLYQFAEYLIGLGYAYIDSQDADAIRANRGTLTEAGRNSPFRDRSAEENLALFQAMRRGQYKDGEHVLRARLDMASPNINMRDPVLYRIRHAHHHRTGDTWCIYPLYDYTHCISDALENITHSLCSLEFEDHRPLYDWVLERIAPVLRPVQFASALDLVKTLSCDTTGAGAKFAMRIRRAIDKLQSSDAEVSLRQFISPWSEQAPPAEADLQQLFARLLATPAYFAPLLSEALDSYRPNPFGLSHQYEFARLNITYVITSKRRIRQLVTEQHVEGWDDPRLPTLYGFRRRGYTPESLQLFCERLGVSRSDSWIDYSILEATLREDLDPKAGRITAVLDALPLIIDNYEPQELLWCEAPIHPHHDDRGRRRFPFTRELAIEREDFMEVPSKGYFRLYPGNRVRLRHAFVVECTGCDKDALGNVVAVHANLLPDTRSGTPGADSIKVKGNIHWVSRAHATTCEVRLYDRLFTEPEPDAGGRDFLAAINPRSKTVVSALLEPDASRIMPGERVQFERHGYFIADVIDSKAGAPVFNRITTLKDSWSTKAG